MPSEQPSAQDPGSTRQGPAEQRQYPPSRGGVRMLLGLPFSDRGAPSTAALTAPPGRQRYGQSPLPAPEESDESCEETAPDEGVIAEAREARSTYTEPSAEQREQTHLAIPGVSTHRTAFPTLSQTADTPTLSVEGEPRHAIPPQAAPLNAPVSLSGARAMTTPDVELLTR